MTPDDACDVISGGNTASRSRRGSPRFPRRRQLPGLQRATPDRRGAAGNQGRDDQLGACTSGPTPVAPPGSSSVSPRCAIASGSSSFSITIGSSLTPGGSGTLPATPKFVPMAPTPDTPPTLPTPPSPRVSVGIPPLLSRSSDSLMIGPFAAFPSPSQPCGTGARG